MFAYEAEPLIGLTKETALSDVAVYLAGAALTVTVCGSDEASKSLNVAVATTLFTPISATSGRCAAYLTRWFRAS